MYKIKSKELQEYIDNNEAIEASCGATTLISLEDVDIIIDRVVKNLTIQSVSKRCFTCLYRKYNPEAKHLHEINKCQISRDYLTNITEFSCEHYAQTPNAC